MTPWLLALSRLRLGPDCHGRPVDLEAAAEAEFAPGYKYEVIHGRWYVSPQPNLPEDLLRTWLLFQLHQYRTRQPASLGYLTTAARVFLTDHATVPEPDIALYREDLSEFPTRRWEDLSPFLVVEVLVDADPHKDLVRNVDLYFQVPSIQEYWIFDGRDRADQPTLRTLRRTPEGWQRLDFAYGQTCTTPTLPGLALLIDPRK